MKSVTTRNSHILVVHTVRRMRRRPRIPASFTSKRYLSDFVALVGVDRPAEFALVVDKVWDSYSKHKRG